MISDKCIIGEDLYRYFFFRNGVFNKRLYDSLDDSNEYKKLFNESYNIKLKNETDINKKKYMLRNDIYETPCCPVCGKKLKYLESKTRFQNHCSPSCARKDINVQNKYNKTCIERYGSIDNFYEFIKIKTKNTCFKKYNSHSYLGTSDCIKKSKKTKLEKYGDENWNNQEKINKTLLEKNGSLSRNNGFKKTIYKKYGKSNYLDVYYLNNERNSKEIQQKIQDTKRKNGTFNKSKEEDISYELIKEKYPDVIRQYKSKEYPFSCDFYIPSIDTYIECNYFWTHGFRPYTGTNEDITKLNEWKDNNTEFYDNAIETWTVRDVEKRKVAKNNNLNYLEFFNINELKIWLNNI